MFADHLASRTSPLVRGARFTVFALASWWIGASIFPASQAFAAAEQGTFEQTVSVGCNEAVTVNVTTASGNVNIRPGDDGVVSVVGHVTVDPEAWNLPNPSPQEAIDRLLRNPPVDNQDGTISVGAITDPDLTQNVSISYEIKVPITTTLKVRIGSGSADIHQIDAPVDAATNSGHVTVTDIKGSVNASTESGDVDVRSITGTATVYSGIGAINGTDLAAPKVTATSGSVKFLDVHGSCEVAVDSGNITVNGDPSAPWNLHTNAGTVAISVTNPANFELNAQTPKGDVHNSLPLSQVGSTVSGTAAGSVGDGGPLVDLSTGAGDISIE